MNCLFILTSGSVAGGVLVLTMQAMFYIALLETIGPSQYHGTVRHTGSQETERAFPTYSKEGRRDTPLTRATLYEKGSADEQQGWRE
jgi:hypothetical protein